MVLLTSTQVSMAISSGIVFTFTFALFLSGYVLQQQTVRGLQAAIKPRLPMLIESIPLEVLQRDAPPRVRVRGSTPEELIGDDVLGDGDEDVEEVTEGRRGRVFSAEHFREREEAEAERNRGIGRFGGRGKGGAEMVRGSIFEDVVVAIDEDGRVVGVGRDELKTDEGRDL